MTALIPAATGDGGPIRLSAADKADILRDLAARLGPAGTTAMIKRYGVAAFRRHLSARSMAQQRALARKAAEAQKEAELAAMIGVPVPPLDMAALMTEPPLPEVILGGAIAGEG